MGSSCSCTKKNDTEEAFFDQYANYTAARPQQKPSIQVEIPNLAPKREKSPKRGGIDWEKLEKSSQLMNLELLKKDLNDNPQNFLINMIMLSVQFFKNFEKDKEAVMCEKKELDDKINDALGECRRLAFVTDLIFAKAQENTSILAQNATVCEPIMPSNYYISYQSIEANRIEDFHSLQNGSLGYSHTDDPIYRVCIDESKQSGNAKLRCLEDYSRRCSSSEVFQFTITSPDEDPEEEKDKEESPGFLFLKDLRDHIAQTTGVLPELSSTKQQSDTERSVRQSVPRSLKAKSNGLAEATVNSSTSGEESTEGTTTYLNDVVARLGAKATVAHLSKLPSKCFKIVKVPILKEDDATFDDPYPLIIDEEEERTYLQSFCVMQHFLSTFFELTRELGMPEIAPGAQVAKSRIQSRYEAICGDSNEAKELWRDFIPIIDVPFWPDSGIEWYLRKRKKFQHTNTGTVFQWPPVELTEGHTVQRIGSNLMPKFFAKSGKNGQNKEANLEWQWGFAKMEHTLQEKLTHPQIRFLIFISLMFRIHLQDSTSLESDCIRHLFYWMLEEDPASWQDELLGDKLILFFKKLEKKVQRKVLNHYFLKKHNFLAKLASHELNLILAQVCRMNENLVFYLLFSLKRLQCDKGFYPHLDCDKLVDILSAKSEMQLMPHNLLSNTMRQHSFESLNSRKSKKQYEKKDNFQRIQEAKLLRAKRQQQLQEETSKSQAAQSDDTNVLDLNLKIKPFSELRKKALLLFFIEHFICLIKKSNEFRAYGQSLMLLLQAQNLLQILDDMGYDQLKEVVDFRIELETLKYVCRAGTQDYWQVNWGFKQEFSESFRKRQTYPLPDPPAVTPELSSGVDDGRRHNITFVEIHDVQQESTDM